MWSIAFSSNAQKYYFILLEVVKIVTDYSVSTNHRESSYHTTFEAVFFTFVSWFLFKFYMSILLEEYSITPPSPIWNLRLFHVWDTIPWEILERSGGNQVTKIKFEETPEDPRSLNQCEASRVFNIIYYAISSARCSNIGSPGRLQVNKNKLIHRSRKS